MKMPASFSSWLVVAVTTATVFAATAADDSIAIDGAVATPRTVTLETLRTMRSEEATYRRGDGAGAPTTVRGVRLAALVETAGPRFVDRHAWKRAVVVATARDGYRVVFSWPELVNGDAGDGVLVVFERDGQPLDVAEGPMALVSTRDTKSGPRSVKWLAQIALRVVDD